MKKTKQLYPGVEEVERLKDRETLRKFDPDDAPRPLYAEMEELERLGWSTEKILVWLNID